MHPFVHTAPAHATPLHVTAEDEQEGLKRTAHMVQEIDRMRRQLELPPEMGHVVLDFYVQQVRSVALEREAKDRAAHTERKPMPIRSRKGNDTGYFQDGRFVPGESASDDRVKPGEVRFVIARPQVLAYKIDSIQITGTPKHWRVHDLTIGNRSQTVQGGTLNGDAFREDGILRDLKLDTAQTAMDVGMVVEYVGPNPEGEPFEAVTVGLVAPSW